MPDSAAPAYDVFISYSTQDKAWVRGELLQTLEKAGLKTCIDYRDFEGGVPTVIDIENKVNASRKVLLVLTPSYIKSKWTEFETLLIQGNDPTNRQNRIIPILKTPCEIPTRIAFLNYLNFTDPEDTGFAWERLLKDLALPNPPALPQRWYFAHSYLALPDFTGRTAELDDLTDWLGQGSQPLYVLRALGGFGKSALTWHWLTHRVEAQRWPQVVWWSFYEESARFENFLPRIFAYLTGRDPGSLPLREQLKTVLDYLQQHPVLIVMDGFERELRAYGGLGAAYQGDEPTPAGEGSPVPFLPGEQGMGDEGRDCLSPLAEEFLRGVACLPGLQGRVLMSTRLRPRAVEQHRGLLAGCWEKELRALAPADAVEFFRRQGVAGNRNELERVCENYGRHPLSLRLVAGYIAQDFEHPNDIRAADSLDVTGDLVQRRNHVLARTCDSLPPAGRQLLGRIACFRSPVAYGVLEAVEQSQSVPQQPTQGFWQQITSLWAKAPDNPVAKAQTLDDILRDLINRGLVQQETRPTPQGPQVRFDLHPIVRRYAYDRMTTEARTAAHGQLRDYFATVPEPERVQALDDLAPVIELYHHMVRAGQYDEAWNLYKDRLSNFLYYQLGAYFQEIDLLQELFNLGRQYPWKIVNPLSEVWVSSALAGSYLASGQPSKSISLIEHEITLYNSWERRDKLAISQGNLARSYIVVGSLESAENSLRIAEINLDTPQNRVPDLDEKRALVRQEKGRLLSYMGNWRAAEIELYAAWDDFHRREVVQGMGLNFAYRSIHLMLRVRSGELGFRADALDSAQQAFELAAETARIQYSYERYFVEALWLLGGAHRVNGNRIASDTHLTDALTRCRTINMVYHEADILLDLARLRADQGQPNQALSLAQQALAIADRCGYVLQGADSHLFLAQHHLAQGDPAQARPHAQAAHRLATCDGGDHTYRVALDEATALLARLT